MSYNIAKWSSMLTSNVIKINVPWFNTSLSRVNACDPLLTIRSMTIDTKIYRLLSLRLLMSKDTIEELMNYAITLMGSYEANAGHLGDSYKVNIAIVLDTVYIVMYMHQNMIRQFKMMEKSWNLLNNNPFL